MTARRPCPPAPGPLEDYATQFDPLLVSVAQRRGLRDYLQGLLLPRDRNKTLTALADAEPITGAQHRQVQRLQWFLAESTWDHEAVNQQRIRLLCADPVTAPHAQGVLVIDDTGDRKDGSATAHVARQYLGSVGKTDNGIVAVTSLWADPRCYWPLHAVPYTPASRLAKGKSDPGFRTKPQLAVELVEAARQAEIPFRAVVADCFYGDNTGFVEALGRAGVAFVLALKPARASGHPMMRRTRRWRRPASLPGVGPGGRVPGGGSPAASATGMPRPGGPPTRCLAAGGRTVGIGWWWPPPTRPRCPRVPPGTCLPTWLARPAAVPSRPSCRRSWVPMGCATGSSRATSRSRTSSAGPTSRSAVTGRSGGTGRWCAAHSASAGTPATLRRRQLVGPAPPATAAPPDPVAARGAQQRLDPDRRHRTGGRHRGVVAAGAAAGARLAGPVGVAAALLARMVDQPAAPAVAAGA